MPYQGNGQLLDFGQAYRKASEYCAIQDRCISEMKLKFRSWNIDKNFFAKLIDKLVDEGFINEKRFALNYAGGKFRINGWGKLKIAAGLRSKSIEAAFIQQALLTIDSDDYQCFLKILVQKKTESVRGRHNPEPAKSSLFCSFTRF